MQTGTIQRSRTSDTVSHQRNTPSAVWRSASATCAARRRTALRAAPGPQVPPVYVQAPAGAADPEVEAYQAIAASAPRPSGAEQARTILELAKHGVLSTLSADGPAAGFPNSSVVEYATTAQGLPIFSISTLSAHTADAAADARAALTVKTPAFGSLADARVTLQGKLRRAAPEEVAALRETYLKKHPNAFYVDFGDFHWYVMETPLAVRFNGGFGAAGKMSGEELLAARPDPVAAFSAPVCGHMNADHIADNIAIVKVACGLVVEDARLLDLDRLGMNAEVKRKGQTFKVRVPFPRPAEDRKSIKEVIVELTKAAKAAQ